MKPNIVIQFNPYLNDVFTAHVHSIPEYKDWVAPSETAVKAKVKRFQKVWAQYGESIIQGLYDATGLRFKRNRIDIHVVAGNIRAYSNPIVIKSRFNEAEFIDCVTHELIHCLFVDNREVVEKAKIDTLFKKEWDSGHPNDLTVITHIPVYAILEKVLGEESSRFVISPTMDNASYFKAWQIVVYLGSDYVAGKIKAAIKKAKNK